MSLCDFLVLCLVAALSVRADVKVDCRADVVSVVWTDGRSQADPSLFRLGNCFPTSVSSTDVAFNVDPNDCNFVRMVSGDLLTYSNNLTYESEPNSHVRPFTYLVVCEFERPKDWNRLLYDPRFTTHNVGELVFHMEMMNDDFSAPADSTAFPLGSFIRILASVEQLSHQPLLLLVDECVASTSPDLSLKHRVYPVITNKGCFVDGKTSRSKFEPRHKSSELRLSLQAFRFLQAEVTFLHCTLVAWDPNGLDNMKKACNYDKEDGWELLDNMAFNHLCDCCESSCKSRKTRSVTPGVASLRTDCYGGGFIR